MQAADQVGVSWISEPCGLTIENSLAEGTMEEGVLYIELLNWPVWETAIASTVQMVAHFTTGWKISS
jgi:hypothetical protein